MASQPPPPTPPTNHMTTRRQDKNIEAAAAAAAKYEELDKMDALAAKLESTADDLELDYAHARHTAAERRREYERVVAAVREARATYNENKIAMRQGANVVDLELVARASTAVGEARARVAELEPLERRLAIECRYDPPALELMAKSVRRA